MNRPTASWSPAQTQALEYAWGEYRVWAATARQKKKEISSWRLRVLLLTIVGALLGTASSQLSGMEATASWIMGVSSSALVAWRHSLAGKFSSPIRSGSGCAPALWPRPSTLKASCSARSAPMMLRPAPNCCCGSKNSSKGSETYRQSPSPRTKGGRVSPKGPFPSEVHRGARERTAGALLPASGHNTGPDERWRIITLIVGAAAPSWESWQVHGGVGGCPHDRRDFGCCVHLCQPVPVSRHQLPGHCQRVGIPQEPVEFMGAPGQDPVKRNRFILDCEEAISIENSSWMAK